MHLRTLSFRVSKKRFLKIAFCSLLGLSSISYADLISVGKGAYTTDLPAGQIGPSDVNKNPVTPRVAPSFQKPPKTNQWWSSLIWKYNNVSSMSQNMFAHPFSFKAQANGLEVGYPSNYTVTTYKPIDDGTNAQEYHYPHVKDLTIGLSGLTALDVKVADYTDWTVTASWSSGNRNLKTTLGSGLPFVYVDQTVGEAVITLSNTPTIWSNSKEVIGLTVNGHHYGLFAPLGSTWKQTSKTLASNLAGKTYYSIAVLPDNTAATLEYFRKHAYAFVTDTKVYWNYDAKTSKVLSTYQVQTVLKEKGINNSNVNNPLMALYRHQWLNTKTPLKNYTYASAKGLMKIVDGSQFVTEQTFTGVLPSLPNFAKDGIDTYNSTQLYTYVNNVYTSPENQRWTSQTDTYWVGKALGRMAHLIYIADQVKHTAARDLFLTELKERLETWLDGKNPQLFYYDSNWKALIGFPASYGTNYHLSDHQFHYGYFLTAAACIAQFDPDWADDSNWGGMINQLVSDVTNGNRNNQQYPFLRYYDVYAGHGWANGPALFPSGNNLESSSEEINYDSALILWGMATNNTALRDLGIFLYTNATYSVPQYWFDVDKQIFPGEFKPNTLAMNWGNGGAYSTWFGGPAQCFHGINFTPIHPGLLYLGKYQSYLKENQAFMLNNGGSNHLLKWIDIHMSIKSLYDPETTILEFNANKSYANEPGESKAHTYHWIHNINQLGSVNSNITANIPSFAVFKKDNVNHYVAYNPNPAAINVTYSDGTVMVVPANSLIVDGEPPAEHTYTDETKDLGEVAFTFKPNWVTKSVTLNYSLNGSDVKKVSMANQNGRWTYTIHGLSNGDKISYYYVYEADGKTVTGKKSEHLYLQQN